MYGWDEAVLYTRNPIVVIADLKPPRRFDYWGRDTVYEGVTWLQVVDGNLCGSWQPKTTRKEVICWDGNGIPGGLLSKDELVVYKKGEATESNRLG